jgi:UDP-N-acetylmuramoyl-tripeptide--D-alanyl-D-alanine ligase
LAERLRSFLPLAPMRMEIKNLRGILFVNDAYNASPTSMEAALATFKDMKGPRRKMAVLGDMLEMGDHSREAHRRIVRMAAEAPFQGLLLVGERMRKASLEAPEETLAKIRCFAGTAEASAFLRRWAGKGDAVLLKASRGIKLEKILEAF